MNKYRIKESDIGYGKEDGSVQQIRRAEKPQDYFAALDCCEMMKKFL